MKKSLWIISILALVAIALVLSRSESSESIRFGFIGPLSGDGVAWGGIEKNAIAMAVDEINQAGGIQGKKISVTYEDGKCEGPTALSAAKKLVEADGIRILLVSCSQEVLSVAPYANAHGVIVFTSFASASEITNAGKYVFRNSWTNGEMGDELANVAIGKAKRAAIISEQSAFASDLRDFFIAQYQNLGGVISDSEGFDQGSRDFRTQISKAIASKPDLLVLNPNGPESGIALIKQVRQLGYKGPLVGNYFGDSAEVQKAPEAEGMTYVSDPTFAESDIKMKVFADYATRYGSEPDLSWPLGARYDAVYLLRDAITSVGEDTTAIADYLHNLPSDFSGVLGTYRFDKGDADISNVQPAVFMINDGSPMPVSK